MLSFLSNWVRGLVIGLGGIFTVDSYTRSIEETTSLSDKSSSLSRINSLMCFPFGAAFSGNEAVLKIAVVGHFVNAIICIGPVSFPMQNFALRPRLAISKILVLPTRFKAFGHMRVIIFIASISSSVPISIGLIFL